ncbi:hypothetical protein AN958_02936 [Leucoagaricus sp. SymC.cos]|nr:hypothetical protein AN958_02936 [Leucoagaricus sp. SymC.cos]
MGIPLDKAEILALFLENIIYGIFLTFFLLLVVISFGEKDIRIANQRFILPVATLMMALATTHLIIDFVRVLQAFVTGDDSKAAHPIPYYEIISHPLHVAKTPVYAIQTILGDAVLVWRCYVIYNKRYYVLVPAGVILLANLGKCIVVSWSVSAAIPGRNIFQTASQWITAFFILTMTLNVCCTSAIVIKIWLTRRQAASASRSLFPVIAVVIESGAIYTSSVLGLLIAYLSDSNGQFSALDLITPLVGVTYCLIVLQIHFHLRISSASRRGATSNWSIPNTWRRPSPHETMTIPGPDIKSYPLTGGVAVHITEQAETHTDAEFRPKNTRFEDSASE